jgi:hypothetical protein
MTDREARADATRLLRKLTAVLQRIVDDNPRADEKRLELLFLDAVTADPVLGEVVWQEGFWDAVNEIRRKEARR